jgi:hypothetical protein
MTMAGRHKRAGIESGLAGVNQPQPRRSRFGISMGKLTGDSIATNGSLTQIDFWFY